MCMSFSSCDSTMSFSQHLSLFVACRRLSGCVSFPPSSFVSDGGVSGCIWVTLPGAVVKLEQSLQVNSPRRPDNTLYHTFYGKVTQEVC